MLTLIKTFKQGLQQPYVDFVPTTSLDTKNWFFLLLPHKIHLCDQFLQCDQLLFTLFQEVRNTCGLTIRERMLSASNRYLMTVSLHGLLSRRTCQALNNSLQNTFRYKQLWQTPLSVEMPEEQLVRALEKHCRLEVGYSGIRNVNEAGIITINLQ